MILLVVSRVFEVPQPTDANRFRCESPFSCRFVEFLAFMFCHNTFCTLNIFAAPLHHILMNSIEYQFVFGCDGFKWFTDYYCIFNEANGRVTIFAIKSCLIRLHAHIWLTVDSYLLFHLQNNSTNPFAYVTHLRYQMVNDVRLAIQMQYAIWCRCDCMCASSLITHVIPSHTRFRVEARTTGGTDKHIHNIKNGREICIEADLDSSIGAKRIHLPQITLPVGVGVKCKL